MKAFEIPQTEEFKNVWHSRQIRLQMGQSAVLCLEIFATNHNLVFSGFENLVHLKWFRDIYNCVRT